MIGVVNRPKRGSYPHFEMYHMLRCAGLEVEAEVNFLNGVRADLVVFKNGEVAVVIEAKGSIKSASNRNTRQAKRYQELPYPVLYCYPENLDDTFSKVLEILNTKNTA